MKQGIKDDKLVVYHNGGFSFLLIDYIICLEGVQRKTRIHSLHHDTVISTHPIGVFIELLEGQSFFRTHRSYFLNLSHVVHYNTINQILLTKDLIAPLSKYRRQEFEEIIKQIYISDGRM